jgi:hypothetical protein
LTGGGNDWGSRGEAFMGFVEWTCMDGPKRKTRYFLEIADGQELQFDVDANMTAFHRANAQRHQLWLVRFEPRNDRG